ncbi:MAG TPA: tail fiber protein [Aliidongia sp.]|nr:tail fiber protein [Aliidongia sp.]
MSSEEIAVTEVYLGQIMMTGFNFAQRGFALCNGQLLSISQNAALFSLLGVNYGGNGTTTFQLPNLQGRVPAGAGNSADPAWQPAPYTIGQPGGTENVTLIQANLPMHSHAFAATTSAGTAKFVTPGTDILGQAGSTTQESVYAPSTSGLVQLAASTIGPQGGNGPHANMQPFRVINFNIALSGVYPARN